jgi:hypothetical protein
MEKPKTFLSITFYSLYLARLKITPYPPQRTHSSIITPHLKRRISPVILQINKRRIERENGKKFTFLSMIMHKNAAEL